MHHYQLYSNSRPVLVILKILILEYRTPFEQYADIKRINWKTQFRMEVYLLQKKEIEKTPEMVLDSLELKTRKLLL